ncbi:MAG: Gfo/Idh/MocA family oxidoreductase [Planctomycetales bacterium]|nr:Gfo/Idh/MocA family oxidoreductase [Planctomycetales bacterium]
MLRRRNFLAASGVAATLAASTQAQSGSSNQTLRVGVMGLSRGQSLALDLAKLENVEVAYLCDVDSRRTTASLKDFGEKTGKTPKVTVDMREILDDKTIDALVCAAPNHWHGPATIMACKAGKHVYVEKPCSHNPQEGEWMVEAAARYKRCVQMGTQRRSAAGTRDAIAKLHAGVIGHVHLARCYYNSLRGSIGSGAKAAPPQELNYDLWQGPVPRRDYRDNVVHYNWHWFWHWGGGELANNGVHGLDLCRWGLDADYPIRVTSSGGRYWFDDDQETPDTQSVCFEFAGGKQATWDALSCNKHAPGYFCSFYGDNGSMELDHNGTYRIFDRNDKLTDSGKQSSGGQVEHLQNFVDAIRANDAAMLNQPILEGHKSTLLCHLGNIAQRTGRTVNTDSSNGHIQNDPEQTKLWRREYHANWEAAVTLG